MSEESAQRDRSLGMERKTPAAISNNFAFAASTHSPLSCCEKERGALGNRQTLEPLFRCRRQPAASHKKLTSILYSN
jgi:hypothetical protein